MPRRSGWDNFGQLLQGFAIAQQQHRQAKLQEHQAKEATRGNQLQLMLALQRTAQEDPEAYNEIIQNADIQDYLDPDKVIESERAGRGPLRRWLDERRDRKQGRVDQRADLRPVTGPRLEAAVARREAGTAQARTAIGVSELEGLVAQIRTGKLKDPKTIGDMILGMTGRTASTDDLTAAELQKDPALVRANIPGTLEFNRNRVNQMMPELTAKYQIKEGVDLQRVRALAEYHMGLRDTPPEALPKAYAQIEADLAIEGQKLRVRELGLSQQNLKFNMTARMMDLSMDLINRGVPPQQAQLVATGLMEGKGMPEGFILPPDQAGELEMKIKQTQLAQMEENLKVARAEDPEINTLFKLLEVTPPAERMTMPAAKKLKDKLSAKFGWTDPKQFSLWESFVTTFAPAHQQKFLLGESTPVSTPAPAPAPAETWNPEMESATSAVANTAMSAAQQGHAKKAEINSLLRDLSAAARAQDVQKAKDAMQALNQILGVQ